MSRNPSSIRCPQCNLLNWSSAVNCKRCGAPLHEGQQTQPPPARAAGGPVWPGATTTTPRSSGPAQVSITGYVGQQIRRCTRNLLLLGCVLLIAVIVAACVNSRYLLNFVGGAQAISHNSLLQVTNADTLARNYVEVQGDDAYDTGMEMVQYEMRNGERTNRQVVATYHALAIGDHLLLVEVGANNHTPVFRATGALENISAHTFEQILQPLYKHEPELRGKFLPVVLKTEGFYTPGVIGLPIGATLLLIGVWCLHLVRRRRAAPEAHPVWTRLARYGPPAEVAAAIDAEVASPQATEIGPVRLTPNWLLHACPFNLQTCALGEMVWAHKKVTKVYYNFVPVSKKFAVIVYDRQRKRTEIQLRRGEKQADQLLGALNHYAPWTILGFSPELSTTWAHNPTELISAVDERRAHYQHNAAA